VDCRQRGFIAALLYMGIWQWKQKRSRFFWLPLTALFYGLELTLIHLLASFMAIPWTILLLRVVFKARERQMRLHKAAEDIMEGKEKVGF
jgi:hypothetical protein